MRDVAKWIRGTLGDGAPIRVFEDERAAAILFVGSTTEPSPGAALLASEPDFRRLPFAEDAIFDAESGTVLETLPFAGRQAGPRINGDAVHNTHLPGSAGILDSAVRDITPYTRPLRQARLRVEELASAKQGSEFTVRLPRETP